MRATVKALVLGVGIALLPGPPGPAAPVVASPATTATSAGAAVAAPAKKKPKRKRGVLKVVATGYPGDTRPRITVAAKRFRKKLPGNGKLSKLRPGKYRVWATPVVDNGGTSAVPDLPRRVKVRNNKRAVLRLDYVWSPKNDTYPPSPATALEVTRSTRSTVSLRWVNGTAPDLKAVAVRRKLGEQAPVSLDDGRPVGTDQLTSVVTDTGLDLHTSYSYSVFMIDTAGNTSRPATVTVRTPGVAAGIAAGRSHSCALLEVQRPAAAGAELTAIGVRDRVECWGANDYGQLGAGDSQGADAPQPVDLDDALKVVTGADHTCALDSGGQVYCWGRNDDGQSDPASTQTSVTRPRPVTLSGDALDVAAGGGHSCAVLDDGAVQCWGADDRGQSGVPATDGKDQSSTVPGVTGAVSIAAGHAHTCAVLDDGAVQCWGANDEGQLGIGTRRDVSGPVTVPIAGVDSLTAGVLHTCALTEDYGVRCWGDNEYGQLGTGSVAGSTTPADVPLPQAAALSAGGYHTCASLRTGSLLCWGRNSAGRLGDGTAVDRSSPAQVLGLVGVGAVAAGTYHTCAATSSGSYCWGSNDHGQLGTGGYVGSTRPTPVLGL